MMSIKVAVLLATAFALILNLVSGQGLRPGSRGRDVELQLQVVNPGSAEEDEMTSRRCSSEFRTADGSCTNTVFRTWGAAGRAQTSLQRFLNSANPNGLDLPSARDVSNMLCQQSDDKFNDRGLNEMATFFGQFLDHTFMLTPPGSESMPIPIPREDPIFANFSGGQLQFSRSVRGIVDTQGLLQGTGGGSAAGGSRPPPGVDIERPINAHSSVLDLAAVYGSNQIRQDVLREPGSCKLRTGPGDILPVNFMDLSNVPLPSDQFFVAGDVRPAENPVLTALHVVFLREHNDLCDELEAAFPDMGQDELFQNARKINGAQFQKIVLEEYYPAIVGKDLPRFRRVSITTRPDVLDVFSTAAFRVGHTMVGNVIARRGPGNSVLPSIPMTDTFFRVASRFEGAEEFIRGATQIKAQEIDLMVNNNLRNFLFTNVPAINFGFDLIAFNLQRSRDHALPSFTEIQELMGMRKATSFADISSVANVQSGLQNVYGTVDRVEAWIGLVAEDHESGSSMGPTMNAIWERQFSVLRDGDRFFFRNRNVFSSQMRSAIPRVNALFTESEIFRSLILRNTNIASSELPNRIFF
ncbi:Animal heme peroxidase homologue [Chondrus crispus]|uniref:Animal heme peroxidase homologue n=1 Tax=Chondrus crispus TaxID=2769 RepID=R7QEC5_CHOCR|nr:Animal heme peroxidase homologue [Chondrus crispus]CDF35806.1 Animal heme peroxidase homologue [Chondrus crispus]|eukprot:XP_005715625.1 Animal heme peroxidase homologue [Chondrus crispus]